jgi:hypothetical protein
MTKKEAIEAFRKRYENEIFTKSEQDIKWGAFLNQLQFFKKITTKQYETWTIPFPF